MEEIQMENNNNPVKKHTEPKTELRREIGRAHV